jgi:hypothetical protein
VTPLERRYLIWHNCVGAAIANAILNGGLGWLATRHLPGLPLWRFPGMAADLAGTAFGIAFGTSIGMRMRVRMDFKAGRIAHVPLSPGIAALVARFPNGVFKRGFGLGALVIAVFALPVMVALAIRGAGWFDRWQYIEIKAAFSAVVGALVTPFIVLAVLADIKRVS